MEEIVKCERSALRPRVHIVLSIALPDWLFVTSIWTLNTGGARQVPRLSQVPGSSKHLLFCFGLF